MLAGPATPLCGFGHPQVLHVQNGINKRLTPTVPGGVRMGEALGMVAGRGAAVLWAGGGLCREAGLGLLLACTSCIAAVSGAQARGFCCT